MMREIASALKFAGVCSLSETSRRLLHLQSSLGGRSRTQFISQLLIFIVADYLRVMAPM
jgi:hypothetical protein